MLDFHKVLEVVSVHEESAQEPPPHCFPWSWGVFGCLSDCLLLLKILLCLCHRLNYLLFFSVDKFSLSSGS